MDKRSLGSKVIVSVAPQSKIHSELALWLRRPLGVIFCGPGEILGRGRVSGLECEGGRECEVSFRVFHYKKDGGGK